MHSVHCPYCYLAIKGPLWFGCAGHGSPGHDGCAAHRDPVRERLTGFSEPVRPPFPGRRAALLAGSRLARCPRCYGETGIRVCPNCHTSLAANYGSSQSPLIAMVGAKGTGKTVYLTVLYRELLVGALRRRFHADARVTGDPQGGYRGPQQWLRENIRRMYDAHQLCEQTPQATNGRSEPVLFEWRTEHRRRGRKPTYRTTYLSFYDTAGEDLATQRDTHDLAYLGAASALILLLDPFTLEPARRDLHLPSSALISDEPMMAVVSRVTETLRSRHGTRPDSKMDIPVAVVLAKMDAFFPTLGADHALLRPPATDPAYDEGSGRDIHEHIRSLLHFWEADDVDIHFRYNYSTFRYFGVSALGEPPDYDNATIRAGGVRPHRIDDPLVWLLGLFGVVPVKQS